MMELNEAQDGYIKGLDAAIDLLETDKITKDMAISILKHAKASILDIFTGESE